MRRLGAAFLLVLMFCAGCGLPIPGGTTAVRTVSGPVSDDDSDTVLRIPPGPAPDEGPMAVVSGFLAAGPAPEVAREYLTAGNSWDPLEGTTVFTGSPVVAVGKAAGPTVSAVATTEPLLTIGRDGETSVPTSATLDFSLTQENGEWRIAVAPTGTQLSQVDLASSFRRGSLGWLSSDRRSLVRQSVLLPGDQSELNLDLVKQLLDGPSLPLVNAGVTSAVPPRFTAVSATQVGSQLTVSLQSNGASISPGDLNAVRAEFAATLLSGEVTSIQVDVNNQPLLGGTVSGAPITAADETRFDRDIPDAIGATGYLATASGIAPLTLPSPLATPGAAGASPGPGAAGASPSPGRSAGRPTATPSRSVGSPAPAAASSLATGIAGQLVALAVGADGQHIAELRRVAAGVQPVLITGSSPPVPLAAGNYTSIAWGDDDSLWLTTGSGDVYVQQAARPPVKASHELTGLRDVVIAPDGVHAVGIGTNGKLYAGLADAAASPPQLTSLSQVAPSLTRVTAVAVVGSGVEGLQLLVAGTKSANPLIAGEAATPVTGIWRVFTGAPDPTNATPESLSEDVRAEPSACRGSSVTGFAARPRATALAECADGTLEALDDRGAGTGPRWVPVTSGVAAYPLG